MSASEKVRFGVVLPVAAAAVLAGPPAAAGQSSPERAGLDRVLAFPAPVAGERLDADRGAAGAWHRLRKLATTASLLHVTAHPDDEHAGMLALASRGWGVRTALLSLNRGEAGANAIGPELFDGLGLIRTGELVLSGRYYGLDDLYFTTAVDYGYSKSVEEAYRSWDREAVLEDMVRVIRLNRPLVVVSRFHGSARDGHGHHHAAGLLTPEAVAAAADPNRFPHQLSDEGLRPWRVARTFRGGVRVDEPVHVEVNAARESPWLGDTYQRWASRGLALQRSQTAGRVRTGGGRYRYERLDTPLLEQDDRPEGGAASGDAALAPSFFEGLKTGLGGLPALLGETVTAETASRLTELERLIDDAVADFDFRAPARSVPVLVRGLALLRSTIAASDDAPETRFHLSLKERQFEDAILAARGVSLAAEVPDGAGRGVVVPGQPVAVDVSLDAPERGDIAVAAVRVADREDRMLAESADAAETAGGGDRFATTLRLRVPDEGGTGGTAVGGGGTAAGGGTAEAAGPYFGRDDISRNHYEVRDSADLHLPWRRPALAATVELTVAGERIVRTVPVTAPVPQLPYGFGTRVVEILPALSLSVEPAVGIIPVHGPETGTEGTRPGTGTPTAVEIRVRTAANDGPLTAETRIELPDGWTSAPATARHEFRNAGETAETSFVVTPPPGWRETAEIRALARARNGDAGAASGGATGLDSEVEYSSGTHTIEHRDLRLARLWRPARTTLRSVSVARLDGLRVGYVMGVGDEVPAGIAALGATVELLDEAALAALAPGAEPLFDAIVVGTRAYAVRDDLREHNERLLEYARRGGNLVVLYQTQEYVPDAMAPYAASLPRGAEEVSEEDAPVRLTQPDHPLLTTPNQITEADFDGWIEQRGSKFFAEWDAAYTPLVETRDRGQPPQLGVWLTARVGEGRYTYMALALHRQLPYGVPGAYRILSNLLATRDEER